MGPPAERPELREHMEAALGRVADAVIAVDSAGRLSYMNAAAEETTGWASSDAVGEPAGAAP